MNELDSNKITTGPRLVARLEQLDYETPVEPILAALVEFAQAKMTDKLGDRVEELVAELVSDMLP